MTIFENSETKIEIKYEFFAHKFIIKHKDCNFLISIDIDKIYVSTNLSNNRLVRIKGEEDKSFKIVFMKDFIRFSDGFFDLYLSNIDLEEIQEKFEEFAREFWKEAEINKNDRN